MYIIEREKGGDFNMGNRAKSNKFPLLYKTLVLFIFISLIFLNTSAILAQPVLPKPSQNLYVFDYADLIDESDEIQMQKIAQAIDSKTGAQIVAVTVDSLSGMEIEEFALSLFRNWGIGDSEKNNGVLILVNKENLMENKRGRIRIEVGYGLEGAITDGKAGAILDSYALPAFETKEYSKGIRDTFLAVSSEVAREYGLNLNSTDLSALEEYRVVNRGRDSFDMLIAIIIFFFIIFFTTMGPRRRYYRRRNPFDGPFFGPFGGGGFGGFGGGGFGGGSFGGGSSGGGGASR